MSLTLSVWSRLLKSNRQHIACLQLYHVEENTIFVHAGIDEDAGENWEWESSDRDFLEKFPAGLGRFEIEQYES